MTNEVENIIKSLSIPTNHIVWFNHFSFRERYSLKSYIQILTRDKKIIYLHIKSSKIDLPLIIELLRIHRPHLLFNDAGQINTMGLWGLKMKRNSELQKYSKLFNSDFEKMVRISDGKENLSNFGVN